MGAFQNLENQTIKGSFQFYFPLHGLALKVDPGLGATQVAKTMETPFWPKEPGKLERVGETPRGRELEKLTPRF